MAEVEAGESTGAAGALETEIAGSGAVSGVGGSCAKAPETNKTKQQIEARKNISHRIK